MFRYVRRWGRWFPERGCILEYEILRFAKMILRDRCSTWYDLASLCRGRRSTLDRWSGKIAKRIGTRLCQKRTSPEVSWAQPSWIRLLGSSVRFKRNGSDCAGVLQGHGQHLQCEWTLATGWWRPSCLTSKPVGGFLVGLCFVKTKANQEPTVYWLPLYDHAVSTANVLADLHRCAWYVDCLWRNWKISNADGAEGSPLCQRS